MKRIPLLILVSCVFFAYGFSDTGLSDIAAAIIRKDFVKAEGLVQELKSRGEYAYIVETIDHAQKKFYRVRIGQLSTLEEAEGLKVKLAQFGYPARIYP